MDISNAVRGGNGGKYGKGNPTTVLPDLLQCATCEEMKPDRSFSRSSKRSERRRRQRLSRCKDCAREVHNKTRDEDPVRMKWRGHLSSSKSRGLFSEVSLERFRELCLIEHCQSCNVLLNLGANKETRAKPNAWTIDRIDSTKGYVADNIGVLCRECNVTKRNTSAHQMKALIHYIETKSMCEHMLRKTP